MPAASEAQLSCQSAGAHVAGVKYLGSGGLSGTEPTIPRELAACFVVEYDANTTVRWPASWMISKPASLTCNSRHPSPSDPHDQFARTSLRRGTPASQDHLWRVSKLMFGALIRAADRWRSVKITEFERRQIAAVSKELDAQYIPDFYPVRPPLRHQLLNPRAKSSFDLHRIQ